VWSDLPALLLGKAPRQVVVQITDRCNATCPQCSMRVTAGGRRSTMPVDTAFMVIEHAAAARVRAISFTGGEPLLDVGLVTRLVRYARQRGIEYTRTGTNGHLFAVNDSRVVADRAGRLADKLVSAGLRNLWISLDSADPATHEAMRGLPGVVAGIERALPIFHDLGLYPAVNLGLTRGLGGPALPDWEAGPEAFEAEAREGLRRFFSRAVELGFTMANVCYPMSVEPSRDHLEAVYAATSPSRLVRFSRPEKRALFEALRDVLPEFRSQMRIFTPLSSVDSLAAQYASPPSPTPGYACRGGVDYVFVDTHGHAYPCGYRGADDLGPFVELDFGRLARTSECRRCDWECFRDPSELFGPAVGIRRLAATLARSARGDDRRLGLWWDDVLYCRAAGMFDGRRAPDSARLRAAAPAGTAPAEPVSRTPDASPSPTVEYLLKMANPGEELDTVMPERSRR
jgi:hypothetical protein